MKQTEIECNKCGVGQIAEDDAGVLFCTSCWKEYNEARK